MFSFLLLGLALALNPSCSDDKNLEPAPEAVNIKVSNYAMLYETVHVNTTNVASGTTVTVNFGEGTVVEGKSGMEIYPPRTLYHYNGSRRIHHIYQGY